LLTQHTGRAEITHQDFKRRQENCRTGDWRHNITRIGLHAANVMPDGFSAKSALRYTVTAISCDRVEEMNEQRAVVNDRITPQTPEAIGAIEELVEGKQFDPCQRDCSTPTGASNGSRNAIKRLEDLTLDEEEERKSVEYSSKSPVLSSPAYTPFPVRVSSGCVQGPSSPSLIPVASSGSPAPSVASSRASSASRCTFRTPREQFLVFIKILFKGLDQANEPEVSLKAKKIVSECTRRNRLGDPNFTPLMEAVEQRLRGFVGEVHWRRSLLYLRYFIAKRTEGDLKLLREDGPRVRP
jgi:hypothetical protein